MASEPTWLAAKLVTEINRLLVAGTGEPFFVRDHGLLESALARPVNHWAYGEDDMAALAASLLVGLARNHPFGQGNKRTAFAAGVAFLRLNGYRLDARDSVELGDLVVDLITGALDEEAFAALLRSSAAPL